jgi:hypothetical protein
MFRVVNIQKQTMREYVENLGGQRDALTDRVELLTQQLVESTSEAETVQVEHCNTAVAPH